MENLYPKHGLVSRNYFEKSLITATIERLAQYEDEGWSDAITPDEVNLNFENPNIEQLLGVMERKVDALMTDAISLMKKGENVFRLTTNEIYRPPPEPSHLEEFEHIMTNFILDQEERITQLKDYMQVIVDEFNEFLSNKDLAQSFFDSINTDPFYEPQWANLFQINEPIFHKLARSLPHLSLMPPLAGMTPYTRVSQLGWEERKGKFPFLNLDRGLVNTPKGNLEMLQHLVV
ncbi:hypothetical protein Tco_0447758 [Tanacetum coccineum]